MGFVTPFWKILKNKKKIYLTFKEISGALKLKVPNFAKDMPLPIRNCLETYKPRKKLIWKGFY